MGSETPKSNLNAPLIETREKEENGFNLFGEKNGITKEESSKIVEEVKKQLWLAGPLISVNVLQFCLQLISVMFVGHLGKLSLSSASMATSLASVTGFSLLMGMGSALDTLCGQSYGAKQYHMLGIHMQRAMFVLSLVSIPLAFVWANIGPILLAVGQDPEISFEAGVYARFMIPSIFAYGLLQCEVRFLQTQSIVFPMMISSAVTAMLHVLVCWVLVFKTGLGFRGAAMANSISYWINALLLAFYIKLSNTCERTWNGFSKEALQDIPNFIRLAIPSAIMISLIVLAIGFSSFNSLETWSFELMVLLSGFLPNPKLEASVLSISLNTSAVVFMVWSGLGAAISTRVSNELGAGNSRAACLAVQVVVLMAIAVGILMGSIMILIRRLWGYAYSNDEEVVSYVATMVPIIAVSTFLDAIQCVLSGTARGCGWQKIGAFINLGAYYLVGIPSAILLAFVLNVGGKGLWFGIICALAVQVVSLLVVTWSTNWEQQAKKATSRVYEAAIPAYTVS